MTRTIELDCLPWPVVVNFEPDYPPPRRHYEPPGEEPSINITSITHAASGTELLDTLTPNQLARFEDVCMCLETEAADRAHADRHYNACRRKDGGEYVE